MRRARTLLRWTGVVAAVGITAVLVILAAGYAYLQTESGRARVVAALNRHLDRAEGTRVRIGRLSGDFPAHIEVHDLSVADDAGTWLHLDAAAARWRPFALLGGRLHVDNLTVEGLRVLRPPRRSDDGEDAGGPQWPRLPVRIRVARFVLDDALLEPPLLGERVAFRVSGSSAVEGPDEVHTTLEITRTDGVFGRAQAEVLARPRSEFLRLSFGLNESGGGVLARWLGFEDLPAVAIRVEGEGPTRAIAGTAAARAGDLARIETRFTLDATGHGAIAADGVAHVAPLVEPPLRDLLSDELAFELDAELTDTGVRLRTSTFANDVARAELVGQVREYAADAEVTLTVRDMRRVSQLAGLPLVGQASARASIRSDDLRKRLMVATRGTLTAPLPDSSPLHALAGGRVDVEAEVELEPGERVSIRGLSVTTAEARLRGEGAVGIASRGLEGAFTARVAELAVLSDMVGTPLTGSLDVAGELGGTLADPSLALSASSPGASVDGLALGSARGRIAMSTLAGGPRGTLDLSVELAPVGEVTAGGRFTFDDDRLHLEDLDIAARQARLAGTLSVDVAGAAVTGRLAGDEIPLAPWSDLTGHALGGIARIEMELQAGATGQRLDARIGARRLAITPAGGEPISVGKAEASARLEEAFSAPRGNLKLEIGDASHGGGRITRAGLDLVAQDLHRGTARVRARGNLRGPFAASAAARYVFEEGGLVVTLTDLNGSRAEQTLSLSGPATIAHRGGTTTLSDATFAVGGGRLSAAGSVGKDAMEVRLTVTEISLEKLGEALALPNVSGSIDGHLRVDGPRSAPSGELLLESADLRSAHTALATAGPSAGRLRGTWRDGRLRLDARLAGVTDTPIEAQASLPLRADPDSLVPRVPGDGTIDGELRWTGELAPIWDLLSPYEDRFSGQGEFALNLSGIIDEPNVGGYFLVQDGRYENVLSGTTLTGVELRLEGNGDKLVLERLSAGDEKSGRLAGGGSILLRPAENYPTNLHLEFGELLLVARDDLILLADGDLALAGTFTNVVLSGRIVTGSSELSLAGTLPPDVVELEVDEVNATRPRRAGKDPSQETDEPSIFILDLDLVVPGRAFVRGLGLDSEWKGEISIGGDAQAPNVSGTLTPVRGHFALLGKRFELESGAIRFTGSDEVDPLLDLTAERRTSRLTALVRVTGSASRPKISLSSRPPLPESEIASQVLFGTDSQSLSPAQSLQLASAIATYSGKGGAIGILDATRRALGVDAINFVESKQNPEETRVSVGKYVTEGVYIELEGGTEEDSRAATTVEVEVLPDVRLEGGTTETGGNKVGVKWRWDY